MCKRIFEENQRFNQWWLWLGMASLVGIFIYQRYPIEVNNVFIITFGVLGLVVVFLFSIHLVTRIDVNGIHVKMFPFHL
ncbi:hypothetical protein N9B55_01805, partial [Vicingaceae bacterium]|nr:hypothetical protein [Vicingaceae bacterium]